MFTHGRYWWAALGRQGGSECFSMDGTCILNLRTVGCGTVGVEGRERLGGGSRGCGCELLFGDGAVDALDG